MKPMWWIALHLFAGQTDRRGWGCLFAAATTGLAATTGVCLWLFTPDIFTWPYSLSEVGSAAAAVIIMGVVLSLLLSLFAGGFGVGNFVQDVHDHRRWYYRDDPERYQRIHSPTAKPNGKNGAP